VEPVQPSNSSELLSKDDIFDLLSSDELKENGKKEDILEPELPQKENKKESKEEEKEEPEIELEEKEEDEDKVEPDEEDLELVSAPRRKEILGAYPDLFKKFPYLEKAFYREQKYTEVLPTIQDAEEAIEARNQFRQFESELLGGKTENVLKQVKESDQNAFAKIVDDYLPSLARVDRTAFNHVIASVAQNFATAMASEANNTNNENLMQAAHLLHQFIFGTSQPKPVGNFSKQEEKNPERDRLEQERSQFNQQRLDLATGDIQSKVENTIKATIDRHIDPKGQMTDYVKRVAIKDAMEDLSKLIDGDSRFQVLKDKLWEKACMNNLSRRELETIKATYLDKAKTYLPAVIKKSRSAALQGLGKRIAGDKSDESPLPVGRTATPRKQQSGNGQVSKGKENPSHGKSTIDFFNED